jgi:hypothetical protein
MAPQAAFILCCTFMLLAIYAFYNLLRIGFGKAIKNVFLAINLNIFSVHRAHRWWLATKFIKSVSLSSIKYIYSIAKYLLYVYVSKSWDLNPHLCGVLGCIPDLLYRIAWLSL